MKLILTRIGTSANGTFGKLKEEGGEQVAVTCERPNNGNQPMGCIPAGNYKVTQFQSPHLGHDFLVHDVPNRSMIEIHKGNTIKDTEGCILVGMSFGNVAGQAGVLSSGQALGAMLDAYPDGFDLEITGP